MARNRKPLERFFVRIIACLTALISISIGAIASDRNPYAADSVSLPSYILIVSDNASDNILPIPDSVFNKQAGSTVFKVNRTELNLADPFLSELAYNVLPKIRVRNYKLIGIDLRGAASPEGPIDNNRRLSLGRSQALIDFLKEHLDSAQVSDIQTINVTEDYERLLWFMEQNNDPAVSVVRDILERNGVGNGHEKAIKTDLRKIEGGNLWYRLLREYYPELRAARVMLIFQQLPEPVLTFKPVATDIPRLSLPVTDVPEIIERPKRHRRHMLALSTNLLYDAFYMPNYGFAPLLNAQLEYFPPRGRYTFLIGFTGPYYHRWNVNKFFQIRDYHLEVRRYFKPGDRHLGGYLAAYANVNKYGIGLSATKGWQGEGFGGAIKAGYVLPLGKKRWRLDLHAALGAYVTHYDPYIYGNPITKEINGQYYYDYTGKRQDFIRRNHRFMWFGPTEIGVSIAFDILYYKPFN